MKGQKVMLKKPDYETYINTELRNKSNSLLADQICFQFVQTFQSAQFGRVQMLQSFQEGVCVFGKRR